MLLNELNVSFKRGVAGYARRRRSEIKKPTERGRLLDKIVKEIGSLIGLIIYL